MLPDFVVIGAQKSATTSLCDLLAEHPRIFMTTPKEPFYFSRDDIYAKGQDWYESLYAEAKPNQLRGEGTTQCTQHYLYPEAPDRMKEAIPDAKLIFMARHPLDRIVSHWIHLVGYGGAEQRPFNQAVREDPRYVDHSLYDHQLEFYRERYGEDRLHVLFFEDFVRDQAGELKRVLDYLGIEEPFLPSREDMASGSWKMRRRDTWLLRQMRSLPGLDTLRENSPAWLRALAVKAFKRQLDSKPKWNTETRSWAVEQLREDAQQFLSRYGKDPSFWEL